MKSVVYIAGPYSAESRPEILVNIAMAVLEAATLRRHGFVVIVPHIESLFSEDSMDEFEWIDHGIELVKRCDAVFDIRRGLHVQQRLGLCYQCEPAPSHGTEMEIAEARRRGIPVFETVESLLEWREKTQPTPSA
jgi:hypothetical protein